MHQSRNIKAASVCSPKTARYREEEPHGHGFRRISWKHMRICWWPCVTAPMPMEQRRWRGPAKPDHRAICLGNQVSFLKWPVGEALRMVSWLKNSGCQFWDHRFGNFLYWNQPGGSKIWSYTAPKYFKKSKYHLGEFPFRVFRLPAWVNYDHFMPHTDRQASILGRGAVGLRLPTSTGRFRLSRQPLPLLMKTRGWLVVSLNTKWNGDTTEYDL